MHWVVFTLLISHNIYSTNGNEDTNLIKNLDSLINVVQTSDDKRTLVDLGIQLGKKNYKKGNLDEAITYFEIAKDAAVQMGDSDKEITCLKFLTVCNAIKGNFNTALQFITPAITKAKLIKDTTNAARLLYIKGNVLQKQGQFNDAIANIIESLELANKINSTKTKVDCLNLLGNIYAEQDKDSLALIQYQACKREAEIQGDSLRLSVNLGNIAVIYKKMGKYDLALDVQKQSLIFASNVNYKAGVSKSLTNIGVIYSNLQEYDSAIIYFLRSLDYKKEQKNKKEIALINNNLGIAYFRMGKYDQAIDHLLQGMQLAEEIESLTELKIASEYLAKSFEKIGNYQQALLYQHKYQAYNDSIAGVEVQKHLEDLRVKYESELKEQKINQQYETIKSNNIIISTYLVGLTLVFTALVIIIFLYRKKQITLKRLAQKNYDLAKADKPKRIIKGNQVVKEKFDDIYSDLSNLMEESHEFKNTELTIDLLAKKLNTNRSDLSEIINNYTGKTYPVYVNELRINHSIRLLKESHPKYSIDAIAAESGFKSVSNFYKLFKESTGMTPSAFQKASRN